MCNIVQTPFFSYFFFFLLLLYFFVGYAAEATMLATDEYELHFDPTLPFLKTQKAKSRGNDRSWTNQMSAVQIVPPLEYKWPYNAETVMHSLQPDDYERYPEGKKAFHEPIADDVTIPT